MDKDLHSIDLSTVDGQLEMALKINQQLDPRIDRSKPLEKGNLRGPLSEDELAEVFRNVDALNRAVGNYE